jgi:hypothetical protein
MGREVDGRKGYLCGSADGMKVARFGVKVVCRKEIQKIMGTVVRAFAFIQRTVNRCRLGRGNEEVTDTSFLSQMRIPRTHCHAPRVYK